mgnify:CR=1 FL=1
MTSSQKDRLCTTVSAPILSEWQRKKCLIVFVRRVEEPKKPFVTVEVSNGKIVQIRGERNSDPTKEVKKFVDLWSRKVLPMALQTA